MYDKVYGLIQLLIGKKHLLGNAEIALQLAEQTTTLPISTNGRRKYVVMDVFEDYLS